MELSENARVVLEKRYLKKSEEGCETPEEMLRRVAENIASAEARFGNEAEVGAWAARYYDIMDSLKFLPNSPTLMNAGRDLQQLSACFVLPVEDSMESIFESIKNAALIHKSGGGTGFSFSRLRPQNDQVLTTGGVASGPISFMKVFNQATEAVKQGGTRRGANMGILRVDHPDILEFIQCKQDLTQLTNFNISVGMTEAFMEAVEADTTYSLFNPRSGETQASLHAREVFEKIVQAAWSTGEPGIVFLDRMNRDNPTPHVGEIESTNPCGEQPLLPYESCNLGSLNLSQFVAQGPQGPQILWDDLKQITSDAVRFLDNVIEVNRYPLPIIEETTKANRKIGLGVMGFADLLFLMGVGYNTQEAVDLAGELMAFIDREAKAASASLAQERGAFPNFPGSRLEAQGSVPLRNATLTTIAPTGTISMIAGCSSGIEPLFALTYQRTILDNQQMLEVHPIFESLAMEQGFYSEGLMKAVAENGGSLHDLSWPGLTQTMREVFVTAHEIEPQWHIRMQAAFQKHVDNAVSKTVNFPQEATQSDIAQVYLLAYQLGCKGVTVYRDGSRQFQVLSTTKTKETPVAEIETIAPRSRPPVTVGRTEKLKTGCGSIYVTINEDEEGLCELFTRLGKSGGCASCQMDAISRLISLALRAGVETSSILKHLRGIRCPSPSWQEGGVVLSCPDAIGIALDRYVQWREGGRAGLVSAAAEEIPPAAKSGEQLMGACPECGGHIKHESGCTVCLVCGFSRCG